MHPSADQRIPQIHEGLGQHREQTHRRKGKRSRPHQYDIGIAVAVVGEHGDDLAAGGEFSLGYRVRDYLVIGL